MVRIRKSMTLICLVSFVAFLGYAEETQTLWQDVRAGEFCLRIPQDWQDYTALAREDLLEDEEWLTLIGCWSNSASLSVEDELTVVLLVLLVEEAAWHEEVLSLEEEATLRDRWEGPVAGESGTWSIYDLANPDHTFWVVYQEPPRADGLHLVLVVGGPRPAPVSDSVIRCMLESVSLCSISHAPCTITVRPGESIQAAIDAASEGAVICLEAGESKENLTIAKSLTLAGQGSGLTVVRGRDYDVPVVRVYAPAGDEEVTLAGLTVAYGSGLYGHGIRIEDSARVTLRDSVVVGVEYYAIVVWEAAELVVERCGIFWNGVDGIHIRGAARARIFASDVSDNGHFGIYVADHAEVSVLSSRIVSNQYGIGVRGEAQLSVESSTIETNHEGIVIWGSARATIARSRSVYNYLDGIVVAESAEASISDTTCAMNENAGLSIRGASRVTVVDSTFSRNERNGVQLLDSAHVSIEATAIEGNLHYGVRLFEPPCAVPMHGTSLAFTGFIAGRSNTINGNAKADVCPEGLVFLMTEEGGELDRRE